MEGIAGTPTNLFLRALLPESYARLGPELEVVDLPSKVVLVEPETPIRSVYFPHTCVLSILVPLKDDIAVEAATVGREGFLGVPILLGGETTATRTISQVPGVASRLPASVFRRVITEDPSLRDFSLRYAQALSEQTSRAVACNIRHELPERCARWLLMTCDRVGSQEFRLSHEFLANMLGVRRATVTVAAGMLQSAGLIRYRRGRVTIMDSAALEEASCECYRIVRGHYERLIGTAAGTGSE
jgi:CRP-like cAMP-binding protein